VIESAGAIGRVSADGRGREMKRLHVWAIVAALGTSYVAVDHYVVEG
jgi:hypothetical protein